MAPKDEQEYREEAGQLKLLPRNVQRRVLAIYRETAENRKIGKKDRQTAIERLAALEKLLGFTKD